VTTTCSDGTATAELPLSAGQPSNFSAVSGFRVGWALRYYHTFKWFGRPVLQLPEDLVRLQEAIYLLRPDIIIETGVSGAARYSSGQLCEALGNGRVIGIDKDMDEGRENRFPAIDWQHESALIEVTQLRPPP